jgi:hypothetical protein
LTPLLLTAAAACGCSLINHPDEDEATRAELERLPEGVVVSVDSSAMPATDYGPDVRDGERYVWKYRVTVQATAGTLTVVDYGACDWENGRWVLSRDGHCLDADEAARDFHEAFDCPKGRLLPGRAYVSTEESAFADLKPRRQKWFVIAEDDAGNRYKGEVELDLLDRAEPAKRQEEP